jgi:hypothetical protein
MAAPIEKNPDFRILLGFGQTSDRFAMERATSNAKKSQTSATRITRLPERRGSRHRP